MIERGTIAMVAYFLPRRDQQQPKMRRVVQSGKVTAVASLAMTV